MATFKKPNYELIQTFTNFQMQLKYLIAFLCCRKERKLISLSVRVWKSDHSFVSPIVNRSDGREIQDLLSTLLRKQIFSRLLDTSTWKCFMFTRAYRVTKTRREKHVLLCCLLTHVWNNLFFSSFTMFPSATKFLHLTSLFIGFLCICFVKLF